MPTSALARNSKPNQNRTSTLPASISIDGPTQVGPGRNAILHAVNADAQAIVKWSVFPKTGQVLDVAQRDGTLTLIVSDESLGPHYVVLSAYMGESLQVADFSYLVSEDAPAPPGPQPNPQPPAPSPTPIVPAPIVPEPSADLKAAVLPITTVLKGHAAEARLLAAYFSDFHDVAKAKPALFKTASALRAQHALSSELYMELHPASVPGISAAIDSALKSMLGLEDAAIEPTKVQAALSALSWACLEGAK